MSELIELRLRVDPPTAKRICDLVDEPRYTVCDLEIDTRTAKDVATAPVDHGDNDEPPKKTHKKKADKPAEPEPPAAVVTEAEARLALADFMQRTSVDDARAKLTALGVEKLSDLPPERFAELVASLA